MTRHVRELPLSNSPSNHSPYALREERHEGRKNFKMAPHRVYSGTPLNRTPLGEIKVFLIVRCPHFRGCTQIRHLGQTVSVLFMEVSL